MVSSNVDEMMRSLGYVNIKPWDLRLGDGLIDVRTISHAPHAPWLESWVRGAVDAVVFVEQQRMSEVTSPVTLHGLTSRLDQTYTVVQTMKNPRYQGFSPVYTSLYVMEKRCQAARPRRVRLCRYE